MGLQAGTTCLSLCCVISPGEMLSFLAVPVSASRRAATAHLPTHLLAHLQNDPMALAEPVVLLLFQVNRVLFPLNVGLVGFGVPLPFSCHSMDAHAATWSRSSSLSILAKVSMMALVH